MIQVKRKSKTKFVITVDTDTILNIVTACWMARNASRKLATEETTDTQSSKYFDQLANDYEAIRDELRKVIE